MGLVDGGCVVSDLITVVGNCAPEVGSAVGIFAVCGITEPRDAVRVAWVLGSATVVAIGGPVIVVSTGAGSLRSHDDSTAVAPVNSRQTMIRSGAIASPSGGQLCCGF
ncbi:hypothetical protein NDR87_32765 [Nocardia sp. CDC159]|uniref:Uncharacterized protein n=1 Tax=Nocardia pulmonis TaxID=2951408 RepID=A0A9X2EDC8_9NOCA|nr:MULTISPECIES: hypothetical protein [Nocardia]MCM6778266.1 hypothetical protein [Nocardia pulmonis]MCM6791155.1 hypothetical protein [Nocardia sp. CDC159]